MTFNVQHVFSQLNDIVVKNNDEIIDPVEEMPVFPEGEKVLFCFINNNLDTIKLNTLNKEGLIMAQFIIDTAGLVKEAKILKGLDSIADNEFLRIINSMPPWEPAKKSNKKVKVAYNLPLRLPYKNKFCH